MVSRSPRQEGTLKGRRREHQPGPRSGGSHRRDAAPTAGSAGGSRAPHHTDQQPLAPGPPPPQRRKVPQRVPETPRASRREPGTRTRQLFCTHAGLHPPRHSVTREKAVPTHSPRQCMRTLDRELDHGLQAVLAANRRAAAMPAGTVQGAENRGIRRERSAPPATAGPSEREKATTSREAQIPES